MNNLIDSLIAPFAAGFVALARLQAGPSATEADITAQAEGDVKHLLRERIGAAVDFLWGFPGVKADIDAVIAAAVTASVPAPADPASPAPAFTPEGIAA